MNNLKVLDQILDNNRYPVFECLNSKIKNWWKEQLKEYKVLELGNKLYVLEKEK